VPLVSAFLRFAAGLRFRQLFFLFAGLFLLNLLVPDVIPLLDEILLGLLALLFGSWKKRHDTDTNTETTESAPGRVIDGEVVAKKLSHRHKDQDSH